MSENTEYLGVSFLAPTILSYVAAFAWMLVVRRMRNLQFPTYKVILTSAWAAALLFMGVVDVTRIHHFDSEWRAWMVVGLKVVLHAGLVSLAWVRYHEIAKLYPVRMMNCRVEPSPALVDLTPADVKTVGAAAELLSAAESAIVKIDTIHQPEHAPG